MIRSKGSIRCKKARRPTPPEMTKQRGSTAEPGAYGDFASGHAAGQQAARYGQALANEKRVRRLVHDHAEQPSEMKRRQVRHLREDLEAKRLGVVAVDEVRAQEEPSKERLASAGLHALDPLGTRPQLLLLAHQIGPKLRCQFSCQTDPGEPGRCRAISIRKRPTLSSIDRSVGTNPLALPPASGIGTSTTIGSVSASSGHARDGAASMTT